MTCLLEYLGSEAPCLWYLQAVDAIFTKVAGWSLRERAARLSKEELMQTQYAQPFTFMAQVGLTELIKSFNLRVTIVSVVVSMNRADRRPS